MSVATPSAATPFDRIAAARPPQGRRLRQEGLTDAERHYAFAMHLSPLAGLLFGPLVAAPLVLWLLRKDQSIFDDDHGREATNAVLSFILYNIAAIVTLIGIVALPVLYVLAIVNMIRGAVAASRGEYFRYPMTIRFIS